MFKKIFELPPPESRVPHGLKRMFLPFRDVEELKKDYRYIQTVAWFHSSYVFVLLLSLFLFSFYLDFKIDLPFFFLSYPEDNYVMYLAQKFAYYSSYLMLPVLVYPSILMIKCVNLKREDMVKDAFLIKRRSFKKNFLSFVVIMMIFNPLSFRLSYIGVRDWYESGGIQDSASWFLGVGVFMAVAGVGFTFLFFNSFFSEPYFTPR